MSFILIITIIGITLFGYVIMGRIDSFIENGGFADSPQVLQRSEILLFGEQKLVMDISIHLSKNNILNFITNEPDVLDNFRFRIVIALSDNDMDNLLLCNKVKHINPDVLTIAKCNDHTYKNVFESVGINRVLTGILTSDSVLFALKGCELR